MSAVSDVSEKLKSQIFVSIESIKKRLFGTNNERLDFVMDSFYKLSPAKRNAVLAVLIGGIAFIVLGAVGIYFAQVNGLKRDLNNSFKALHELKEMSKQYEVEDKKFTRLLGDLQRKTSRIRMKPFFEKISREMNVKVERLEEKRIPLPADNPMADRVTEVNVDMDLPKISIPRMLKFLVEVEKSKHYLRVKDLQVRARYGTKLFFDVRIKVRGYEVTNQRKQ